MMRWTYNGVNFSLPGAGGPACSDYLSLRQKIAETFLICFVSFLEVVIARLKIVFTHFTPFIIILNISKNCSLIFSHQIWYSWVCFQQQGKVVDGSKLKQSPGKLSLCSNHIQVGKFLMRPIKTYLLELSIFF